MEDSFGINHSLSCDRLLLPWKIVFFDSGSLSVPISEVCEELGPQPPAGHCFSFSAVLACLKGSKLFILKLLSIHRDLQRNVQEVVKLTPSLP